MPELPEVETIVSGLRESLINATIDDVNIRFTKCISNMSSEQFRKKVIQNTIQNISRRAKYIIFSLSKGETLLLHLRMTGKVTVSNKAPKPGKHDHVIFTLANGKYLIYNDTRKFGRFTLTNHPEIILNKLGPEPLGDDFNYADFSQKLSKTNRKIKAVLLDQSFVAGLGNIYTDESLWLAKIHPEIIASRISKQKQTSLFAAIKQVLIKGIKNKGTSLGDGQTNYTSANNQSGTNQHALMVFARTGEPCFSCQTPIKKIIVAQRGTHFCPKCQKMRK